MDLGKISIFAEQATKAPRYAEPPAEAFPAASLWAWLEIADRAGVACVPAEIVADIDLDSVLHFDTGEANRDELLKLRTANEGVADGQMLRWDCCASEKIKWLASKGLPECPTDTSMLTLAYDDCRAFEILYEFPAQSIKVLRRPWVKALLHEGFPVEFRVYINNGKVEAVSNYYPQRDLPQTEDILGYVSAAVANASKILEQVKAENRFPWVAFPRQIPEEKQRAIQATLDFMVTEDRDLVFLEAGPGFGFGAHPCCFLNPETYQVSQISGICLAKGGESFPLVLV